METTLSNEEIIEALGEMTVNELVQFIDEFKARFGVEIIGPGPTGPSQPAQEAVVEADAFDVILDGVGDKTINVIKEVRDLTKLGLKESKEKTVVGSQILAGVNKIEAEAAKRQLEAVGATVTIRPVK